MTGTYSEPYLRVRLRTTYPGVRGYTLWLTGEHVHYVVSREDAAGNPTSEARYRWDTAGLTAEWPRTEGRLLAGAELYNRSESTEASTVVSQMYTGVILRAGASAQVTRTLELRAGVKTDLYYRSASSRPTPESDPTWTSGTFGADADPYLGLGWQLSDWTVDIVFPMNASSLWRQSTEYALSEATTVQSDGVVAFKIGARRSF